MVETLVWMSGVQTDTRLGRKPALRSKLFGEDWTAATHILGLESQEYRDAMNKNAKGIRQSRHCLPECFAIWSPKDFSKTRDIFYGRGYMIVRQRLADVLSKHDLGGTELVPVPIYQQDLVTLHPENFFFLSFGSVKKTFLPTLSRGVSIPFLHTTGSPKRWQVDGRGVEIFLLENALLGSDLWHEENLDGQLFMNRVLYEDLKNSSIDVDRRRSSREEMRVEGGFLCRLTPKNAGGSLVSRCII